MIPCIIKNCSKFNDFKIIIYVCKLQIVIKYIFLECSYFSANLHFNSLNCFNLNEKTKQIDYENQKLMIFYDESLIREVNIRKNRNN